MYGANMGTLRVDYSNQGGAFNGIWSRAGNQGDTWTPTFVDIAADTTGKVIILNNRLRSRKNETV